MDPLNIELINCPIIVSTKFTFLSLFDDFIIISDERFNRMRAVIDEKAIECDTMRKRLQEAAEAQMKTVDKDLAKNIVLKYLALPGKLIC